MIIAETERLLISKFSLDDAPFFLKLANTPNWIKYIGDRNLKTVEELAAITLPINTNSKKLLNKLGFTYEKRVKPFEDDEELLLFAKQLDLE
jgi:hypothetical protein